MTTVRSGMGLDVVRWGAGRVRVGAWRGDESIAYVSPVGDGPAPDPDAVRRTCADLARRGFRGAVTAALGPAESRGFLLAGFEVHEHLHLLAHDLLRLPTARPCAAELRRGRKRDRAAALEADALAFSSFWQLDEAGLDEAIAATPTARFRVAELPAGEVSAYAVTGRSGRRGFLQRLAVHPRAEGHGVGSSLVLDGLVWLARRGCERVVVNTQESNERALRLYEEMGFRRQPGGLAVLRIDLR